MNSTIFGQGGGPPGSQTAGNTLFVDAIYGNDTTKNPYLTLGAAKADATSGQLIYVRPGSYTVTDTILKDGVNWWFATGCTVSKTITSGHVGPLDDNNSAITCAVFGEARFVFAMQTSGPDSYGGCLTTHNTASNITVGCRSLSASQDSAGQAAALGVYGDGGTLRVKCSEYIYASDASVGTSGIAVYWTKGLNIIEAPTIFATNNAIWTSNDNGSVAENMYITAEEIYTTATTDNMDVNGVITAFGGGNANAAVWITCGVVQGNQGSNYSSVSADASNSNKVYVRTQKLYGFVTVAGGLIYVDSDKSEAIRNVTGLATSLFVSCSGGTLRYNVRQHDPKSFTGIAFLVNGGTLISNEIEYTSGSGSDGMSISSGTARLQTAYLNTAANSSGNPIAISGGTLILMANTLVSQGARNSITAGTAQNVVAMSSWANNLANVNVTISTTGGLTVNSNVA